MKETPLLEAHQGLGARLVDFAGWRMPVQYSSILEEARAVRQRAGLFDLSHMGRVAFTGADAVRLADLVLTNHCARIPEGSIRYALLCREDGYPLDDLLVYREPEGVYLVSNASNTERDLAWIRERAAGLDVRIDDQTASSAMLAVQGPRATEILQGVTEGLDLATIKYYRFDFATVCGMPKTRISRTGYTGENGYEIYFPAGEGLRVWEALLAAGRESGLEPIGLGARDILRLEAGMPLYGHEIDEEHNPLEAGLDFAISFTEEKGDFVGRSALERMSGERTRRLVGITTEGPRVPRQGHRLFAGDLEVGHVCSGGVSPTLDTNIGSAYVSSGHDVAGSELELDIRGKRQRCLVRELPFYSRTRKTKSPQTESPKPQN